MLAEHEKECAHGTLQIGSGLSAHIFTAHINDSTQLIEIDQHKRSLPFCDVADGVKNRHVVERELVLRGEWKCL